MVEMLTVTLCDMVYGMLNCRLRLPYFVRNFAACEMLADISIDGVPLNSVKGYLGMYYLCGGKCLNHSFCKSFKVGFTSYSVIAHFLHL